MSRYITNPDKLRKRLGEAQTRKGLTNAELARAAGLTYNTVRRVLSTHKRDCLYFPEVATLCALCETLGLTVEEVLREEE